MGLYSTKTELYLNQYTNPLVKEGTEEFLIRGHCNNEFVIVNENPFRQKLISEKIPGQKVIVLGLYVTYIQSDMEATVIISNLFKNKLHNDDVDRDSGTVEILCPKDYDKSIQGNDRVLYRPSMSENLIRHYAGMTEAILEARQTEVFPSNHPIVMFAKQLQLPLTSNEEGFIMMDKETFEKTQSTFANHIQNGILETDFDATKIYGKLENKKGGTVNVMLKMKYLLITPGEMKLKINELRL
jgi:hypothetical protein